ncbi:MAG: ABC transporter substrate-binding protein [Parvibaculaceae bacterium]
MAFGMAPAPGWGAEAPKRGGRLAIAADGGSASDGLDPLLISGNYLPLVGLQLHNTLLDIAPNGELTPQLAMEWTPGQDGKRWVFKIRTGVTFHNGKELTAADVVYSLNRHRGKDSKSPVRVYFDSVSDIQASGKHEVTMSLEAPDADVPYMMTDYRLAIVADGVDPNAGVGTGAFVLDSFQPGVRTITRRNDNYWRSDRGFVDSVETLSINDPVARLGALLSGRVHLINKVETSLAVSVEQNPKFKLYNVPSGSHCIFPMRCDSPPFDNPDLRLALKYAVDRERLLKVVLKGYGQIGNDQPIPTYDPFYSELPQTAYDIDKARHHLKKSGFTGTIPMSVADTAFAGAVAAAQVIQASASKAGLNIDVVREPADGYWDNVWMKKPLCASNWSGRPTANLMLSVAYKSDAAWNETAWKRPEFDKILVEARGELDIGRRREMYHTLQMMIHDDGGALIPLFNNYLDGASHSLKGFVSMGTFELSGYRAPEQVWLED